MEGIDVLLKELKRLHGVNLDLKNNHYYLFLDGAVFTVWFDEDEKKIDVNVTFLDSAKVYHTNLKIDDVFK